MASTRARSKTKRKPASKPHKKPKPRPKLKKHKPKKRKPKPRRPRGAMPMMGLPQAAATKSIRCPRPPKKPSHVVDFPPDAKVGDALTCIVGHALTVTSVDPPKVA